MSAMAPDSPRVETSDAAAEQNAVELQELELAARRLEFQAAQWKQQLALRKERLQLKSEEINGKETLTRQQQQVEAMEIRARVLRALGEMHKTPEQIREYLTLLEG